MLMEKPNKHFYRLFHSVSIVMFPIIMTVTVFLPLCPYGLRLFPGLARTVFAAVLAFCQSYILPAFITNSVRICIKHTWVCAVCHDIIPLQNVDEFHKM